MKSVNEGMLAGLQAKWVGAVCIQDLSLPLMCMPALVSHSAVSTLCQTDAEQNGQSEQGCGRSGAAC